jgi:hypothetical protein
MKLVATDFPANEKPKAIVVIDNASEANQFF